MDEHNENDDDRAYLNRVDFIRETAQLLFVYGRPDSETPGLRRPLQPGDAWKFAKALWDAKPEGC